MLSCTFMYWATIRLLPFHTMSIGLYTIPYFIVHYNNCIAPAYSHQFCNYYIVILCLLLGCLFTFLCVIRFTSHSQCFFISLFCNRVSIQCIFTHWTEVISNLSKFCLIQTGIILSTLECLNHNLCCRLTGSHREWADRRIYDVTACLYCLHISHRSHTGSIMCMQVDRNLYRLFQCLYKLCSLCRNKQTSHIFDTK